MVERYMGDDDDLKEDGVPPDSDEQRNIEMHVTGRVGHSAILRGRKIVLWGGYTRNSRIKSHFLVIDIDTGKKQLLVPLLNERDRHPALPIDDRNSVLATCYSASAFTVYQNLLVTFGGHSLLTNHAVNFVFGFRFKADTPNQVDWDKSTGAVPIGEYIEWNIFDLYIDAHPRRPSPRDKHAIFLFDNKICSFGGYGPSMSLGYLNDHGDWHMNEEEIDDRGWNNQFLTFDLLTRLWQNPKTTGAVPCPRAAHSMCLLGNRAYLFGGRSSPRRLNDLYFLDLNALQWTQLQLSGDIPCQRSWGSLTHMDTNSLLIFGGMDNKREVVGDAFVVDLATSHCRRLNIAPEADTRRLWHVTLATEDSRVLVVGGCSTSIYSNAPVYPRTFLQLRLHKPPSLYSLCLRYCANHIENYRARIPVSLNHFVRLDLINHRSLYHRTMHSLGCGF